MKIDCGKSVNFLNEWNRMCEENQSKCSACPLSFHNNDDGSGCFIYPKLHPSEAVKIVQKWSDKHPLKTYAEDFFEKFPNAAREIGGTPKSCWRNVYGSGNCPVIDHDCAKCWNRIMEDKPND